MQVFILFSLLLVGVAYAEIEGFNVPNLDNITVVKERCDQKGGEGTYEKVKAAKDYFITCVKAIIDVKKIEEEVEAAKKTGSMDEVFGKYCNKRPELEKCVNNMTETVKLCLEQQEKDALKLTLDILKQLGDFVCYKDGDRLAMFVAEGGVKCLKSHAEGIKDCLNATFQLTPPSATSTNALPNILIDKKKCDDLGKVQTCVVAELEKCEDSTPANIIDALFRFIKKTACKDIKKRSLKRRDIELLASGQPWGLDLTVNGYVIDFKENCIKNYGEMVYKEFEEAFNSSRPCIASYIEVKKPFVTPQNEFKNNILNCTKNVLQKSENCLDEAEKFYPSFFYNIVMGAVDFGYKYHKNITTSSWTPEFMHCFTNFRRTSTKPILTHCFANLIANKTINEKYTKEDICHRMKNLKKCIEKAMDTMCIKDISIDEVKNDFFNSIMSSCENKD